MGIIEGAFSDVAIIGNGFDLNLGLRTSYSDFMESEKFLDLADRNDLAKHLAVVNDSVNWVDIEEELIRYSKNASGQKSLNLEKDFVRIRAALMDYMAGIKVSRYSSSQCAYSFIKELVNTNFLIFDFNYTGSTKEILRLLGVSKDEIELRLIKVHGSVEEGKIIFGVQDNADIRREHIFLRKAYAQYYQAVDMEFNFKRMRSLHVFGHSLGVTDHSYFTQFFGDQSKPLVDHSVDFYFYYYGDLGYNQLVQQLEILTEKRLGAFRKKNQVHFIDVSGNNEP